MGGCHGGRSLHLAVAGLSKLKQVIPAALVGQDRHPDGGLQDLVVLG
jgi:hypothetical protein